MDQLIGNTENISLIQSWLSVFLDPIKRFPSFKNAIFITGPTGSGKSFLIKTILSHFKFDIFEYSGLEVRTEKVLYSQLSDIMSGKSVLQMVNKSWKAAVIIDELESMDFRERASISMFKNFLEWTKIRNDLESKRSSFKPLPKKKSKKPSKSDEPIKNEFVINKVPMIYIASKIEKWMQPLLRDCIHIDLIKPSSEYIQHFWSIYNPKLTIPIEYLPSLVKHSDFDYRKAIQIADWLSMFMDKSGSVSIIDIEKVLTNLERKEMDISTVEALDGILLNPKSFDERIYLGSTDYTYLPWISLENFPLVLKHNYKMNDSQIQELLVKYYENFIAGQHLNNSIFGNWEMIDIVSSYWGILPMSTIQSDSVFHKKKFTTEVSSVSSRYSLRNTNHKTLIPLCKKLDITYEASQLVAAKYIEILESQNTSDIFDLVMKHHSISWESDDIDRFIKHSVLYESNPKLATKIKNGISIYTKYWNTL
jgi:hypothetical protein